MRRTTTVALAAGAAGAWVAAARDAGLFLHGHSTAAVPASPPWTPGRSANATWTALSSRT
jgi:hypothetical protein